MKLYPDPVALGLPAASTIWVEWKEVSNIAYSPTYTRITGSLPAGVLLSQVLYWFRPSPTTGKSKLRVKKDGVYWLAKSREDWCSETGLTLAQLRGALDRLIERGFIETKRFRFAGDVTVHVRLNHQRVANALAIAKWFTNDESATADQGAE